jgi:threonine dehydrogenase-like Zn-dependent dehydrogenase
VIAASTYKPKHLFAVDSTPSRLELARSLGAEPLNYKIDREGLDARIKDVTEGRGADVVLEAVGQSAALRLGFDILRPWGIMSSVGVHNGEVCNLFIRKKFSPEGSPQHKVACRLESHTCYF